jgi:hypothetical protein
MPSAFLLESRNNSADWIFVKMLGEAIIWFSMTGFRGQKKAQKSAPDSCVLKRSGSPDRLGGAVVVYAERGSTMSAATAQITTIRSTVFQHDLAFPTITCLARAPHTRLDVAHTLVHVS